MPMPIRSLFALVLVIVAAAVLNATPVRAASPGHGTTPHVSCSYPGAPDCNMGPPSGGSGGGSTGCGVSCGGGTTGGGSNSNCLVSLNGTCLISGGSSQPSQPQSSSCPTNYTPSVFGCQPPVSNVGGVTAGGSCSNGQVPASQIGIASSVCVNPNSSTSSGGPPPLQTKSCPGYAQQFPAAQSCPVPLPSSNGCDIVVHASLDAGDTTVSQACGGAQTNPLGVAGPTPCDTGIAYPPVKCVACDDGSTAPGRDQCPPGTMQSPCSPGQACTYCFDNSTAYPPSACPKPPPPPAPSPTPSPATSAAAGCGGSSLLLPTMDLRVGQSPSCVNCYLPGATTGTLMDPGACAAAGGSLTPPTASGGGTRPPTGAAAARCAASALLLPSLDLRVSGAFPGCINCHLPDGTTKSESVGDCVLDGGDWAALGSASVDASTLATAACASSTGLNVTFSCGALFGAAVNGSVPPEKQTEFIACIKGALAAALANAGTHDSDIAAAVSAICGPLVTPPSTTVPRSPIAM
jgi:hypothetical protein